MNAELIWNLLIKGSAILILAGLVTFAMRRSSASRRHLVWVAALVAILLIPVAQLRLPSWHVPVNRAPMVAQLLAPSLLQPIVQAPGKHALFSVSPLFTPRAPVPQTPPFDYVAVIQAAWSLGCFGLLSWTAFGLLMVGLLVRKGTRSELAENIGREVAPGIRILVCPKLRVPAMAGIIRPAILLPSDALLWDRHRLQMVIAHEAAHIRRKDWLWQILGQTACAVHFFNPMAWVALKQLRKESELACDDFVLGLGFEPDSYAHTLLDIARKSRFQVANTVGMARCSNVEGRLKSIVDARKNRHWVSGRTALSVLVTVAVIVTPLALVKAMPRMVAGSNSKQQSSGPSLPQIPWLRSKEVAPNTFLARNGVAGLPGGYLVKLIGICADDSSDIWGLTGKPLPGAENWVPGTGKYWSGNVFKRGGYGPSRDPAALNRTFFVEVESESDAAPSTTFNIETSAATAKAQQTNSPQTPLGEKAPEVPFRTNDPAYAPLQLGIPNRAETGTFRFGLTTDNWQTVADVRNPVTVEDSGISRVGLGDPKYGDQCMLTVDDKPHLWYLDPQMKDHTINLLDGQEPLPSDVARRVLLFNKDGQPIDPGKHAPGMDGFQGYEIKAKDFSRIARAVIQTTPYIWAEFRNVPLLPDFEKDAVARVAAHAASLESGVHGTATGVAPGFTRTLSDGTTVSITSVTKAIRDDHTWVMTGQPSWRADGEVLAERPDLSWFGFPYSAKSPGAPEQLGVNVTNSPSQVNTIVRFTAKFDPKTHKPIFKSDTRTIQVTPQDKFGAAQVGVATGTWVTVSSQDIDMRELPAVETSDPRVSADVKNRTGFEVVVGSDCYVRDLVTGVKVPMASKPLSTFAVRVVARLKSGELRELRNAMSAAEGSIYAVPARHGEWTEGYNQLIASEVQSVEIQVRGYEFVEFDGIALQHR